MGSAGPAGRRRRRRTTAGGAFLGFIMLVVLVVTVLVLGVVVYRTMHPTERVDPLAGRSGTTASTSTTLVSGSTGTDSSTSTSLAAILLRPTASTSSSALKATTTNNFRATNLVDGDVTTAWTEGGEGVGLGEWVRFKFSSPTTLARLDVANGNQMDEQRFKNDVRVKTVQLEYSNGSTQLVDLLDTEDIQSINTLREETDWLKLTIVSVYPDYVWADAALSEVRLYGLADQ